MPWQRPPFEPIRELHGSGFEEHTRVVNSFYAFALFRFQKSFSRD